MNTKYIYISTILILLCVVGYTAIQNNSFQKIKSAEQQTNNRMGNGQGVGQGHGGGMNNPTHSSKNCISDECLLVDELNYPAGNLTDVAKIALNKALDDEYKAQATYESILAKLGNVRPFVMIIRAEEHHISSLKALFDKYGLAVPNNPYTGKVISPENLSKACTAGAEAEIANASLYKNELLPEVKDYEDITVVFTNLMNASQERHLPAFQRCAN